MKSHCFPLLDLGKPRLVLLPVSQCRHVRAASGAGDVEQSDGAQGGATPPADADAMRLAFDTLGYVCEFERVAEDPAHFQDVFDVAAALTAHAQAARLATIEAAIAILHEEGWLGRSEQRIRALKEPR